jgi:hypothetical protein
MTVRPDMRGIISMKQRASYAIRPIRGGIADLVGVADRDAKQIPDSVGAFRTWHKPRLPCALAADHAARAAQLAAKL